MLRRKAGKDDTATSAANVNNEIFATTLPRHRSSNRTKSISILIYMIAFIFCLSMGFLTILWDKKSSSLESDTVVLDHDSKLTTTNKKVPDEIGAKKQQQTHEVFTPPKGNHRNEKMMIDPTKATEPNRNGSSGLVKDMKTFVTEQMQVKLSSLPSPPWPQLDHKTAKAIATGLVLGLDNTKQLNFNNTIVTAYYEFESKHGVGQYKNWMVGLFQTSDPMIIFVEPKSKWFDFIQESRQHAPTILVSLSFDDLVMSTTFTKEFWDHEHSIDLEAKTHKGSGVYKIWNEKLIFIYNAVHLNPFQTPGFAWMDAGYFRNSRDAPNPSTPVIRVNYTNEGKVPKEKVLVLHVRDDGLNAPGRVNVAGNSFFGSGEAFLDMYNNYYITFWDWISQRDKFIGSDQFVMTETCRRYPTCCYPYFPGRFKKWFALSAVVMGKEKITGVSPKYLFLDEPPHDLPILPEGKKITYCKGKTVTVDDALCKL